MQPKISVIVPIYKAEKYLHRCVDSILAQTFTNFELILVDDGSPDGSGAICDEYAKKDSRIKVFHQENGGVSSARQCGIDNATGEYTIHIDPDDWVEPEMLKELYEKAIKEDADMVICDFFINKATEEIYSKQEPSKLDCKTILRELLLQLLHGSCWNKLIKRTCYINANIKFPMEIIRWEDLYVVCEILLCNVKVAYLNKAFYHYDLVINPNSIVRIPSLKGVMSQIYFVEHFSSILSQNDEWHDCLYKIKSVTKELAFVSRFIKGQQLKDLFDDINIEYINTNKNEKSIYSIKFYLTLFLDGTLSYSISLFLLRLTYKIRTLLKRIIQIFR